MFLFKFVCIRFSSVNVTQKKIHNMLNKLTRKRNFPAPMISVFRSGSNANQSSLECNLGGGVTCSMHWIGCSFYGLNTFCSWSYAWCQKLSNFFFWCDHAELEPCYDADVISLGSEGASLRQLFGLAPLVHISLK